MSTHRYPSIRWNSRRALDVLSLLPGSSEDGDATNVPVCHGSTGSVGAVWMMGRAVALAQPPEPIPRRIAVLGYASVSAAPDMAT